MKIVVTGATGNVGTSVVRALAEADEIVGIARRRPAWQAPRVRWVSADVARDDLAPHFAGADAVIHLAWLIQPSRDDAELARVNVEGSRRVFEAAARAGVKALVHASSVGVYSPGPKDRAVDESWPREGVETLFYARHKAQAERALDAVETANPRLRVVRLRPGLIFKREAGPGDPPAVRRPVAPRVADSAGTAAGAAAAGPARPAVRARRRHRRGLPARRAVRARLRRLQHRRRPGARSGHARSRAQDEARPRSRAAAAHARLVDVARPPATRAARLARHGPRRSR